MCLPPPRARTGSKGGKISSAKTRPYCGDQTSCPGTSPMPPYYISHRKPVKPSKPYPSPPPVYSRTYTTTYPATWSQHQLAQYGTTLYTSSSNPLTAQQDPAYIAWQKAQEDALTRQLADQAAEEEEIRRQKLEDQRHASMFRDVQFVNDLKAKLSPSDPVTAKQKDAAMKEDQAKRDEAARKVQDAVNAQLRDLQGSIKAREWKDEIAEVQRAAREEGKREAEEKVRREEEARKRERDRESRERDRSRGRSRERSRGHHVGGTIGYGGSGMGINDPNTMGLIGQAYNAGLVTPRYGQFQMENHSTGLLSHQHAYSVNPSQNCKRSIHDITNRDLGEGILASHRSLSGVIDQIHTEQQDIFRGLTEKLEHVDYWCLETDKDLINTLRSTMRPQRSTGRRNGNDRRTLRS